MLIRVDAERCEGHGLCEVSAGEVYRIDERTGRNDMGRFQVGSELAEAAARGARSCPERAILVEVEA